MAYPNDGGRHMHVLQCSAVFERMVPYHLQSDRKHHLTQALTVAEGSKRNTNDRLVHVNVCHSFTDMIALHVHAEVLVVANAMAAVAANVVSDARSCHGVLSGASLALFDHKKLRSALCCHWAMTNSSQNSVSAKAVSSFCCTKEERKPSELDTLRVKEPSSCLVGHFSTLSLLRAPATRSRVPSFFCTQTDICEKSPKNSLMTQSFGHWVIHLQKQSQSHQDCEKHPTSHNSHRTLGLMTLGSFLFAKKLHNWGHLITEKAPQLCPQCQDPRLGKTSNLAPLSQHTLHNMTPYKTERIFVKNSQLCAK